MLRISETARRSQGFGARPRLASAPKRFHELPNAQEYFAGFRGSSFTPSDITSTSEHQQYPNPAARGPFWDTEMSVIHIPPRLPFRLLHKPPAGLSFPHCPSSSYPLHRLRSGLASSVLSWVALVKSLVQLHSSSLVDAVSLIAWSTPGASASLVVSNLALKYVQGDYMRVSQRLHYPISSCMVREYHFLSPVSRPSPQLTCDKQAICAADR